MPLLVDHKLRGKSELQLFQLLYCAATAKLPSLSEPQFLHLWLGYQYWGKLHL